MTYAVDLGKIKFNWQGNYNAATTYTRDDVVYHNGNAYVCVVASSVNQDPSTATAQWNKMAQGSDLGAISGLSANDLIYYDGSDFQRLAAGAQGEALLMGSSGLEWGEAVKSGNVMEVLTGLCNGQTQTVQSGTYTLPNVTGNQAFSTSYSTVTGSEFTYTPPAGATRVIYEFQYLFEARSNGGISHHKFFIDNVEVTNARTNLAHEYSTSSHGQLLQTYKWIINCNASANSAAQGAFTSWTSPKTMKWQARDYSSSYRIRAHINTWWDGTSASGSNTFRVPILTITAIK